MTHTCPTGSGCLLTFIGVSLAWLLISSALLWQTWNKVIGGVFKVKAVKLWQALLLVVTVCAFFVPCSYMKKVCGRHGSCCHHSSPCHSEQGEGAGKGDCPYARHGQSPDSEPKKTE